MSADGETLVDFGDPLAVEQELGLLTWEEASALAEQSPDREEELFDRIPDEDTVIELAAALSLDPSTLEGREAPGLGRLGEPD